MDTPRQASTVKQVFKSPRQFGAFTCSQRSDLEEHIITAAQCQRQCRLAPNHIRRVITLAALCCASRTRASPSSVREHESRHRHRQRDVVPEQWHFVWPGTALLECLRGTRERSVERLRATRERLSVSREPNSECLSGTRGTLGRKPGSVQLSRRSPKYSASCATRTTGGPPGRSRRRHRRQSPAQKHRR